MPDLEGSDYETRIKEQHELLLFHQNYSVEIVTPTIGSDLSRVSIPQDIIRLFTLTELLTHYQSQIRGLVPTWSHDLTKAI